MPLSRAQFIDAVARLALDEAVNRVSEGIVPADDYEAARIYAEEALDLMKATDGYDPLDTLQEPTIVLAKIAARAYVHDKIMGGSSYLPEYRKWQRKAAVAHRVTRMTKASGERHRVDYPLQYDEDTGEWYGGNL